MSIKNTSKAINNIKQQNSPIKEILKKKKCLHLYWRRLLRYPTVQGNWTTSRPTSLKALHPVLGRSSGLGWRGSIHQTDRFQGHRTLLEPVPIGQRKELTPNGQAGPQVVDLDPTGPMKEIGPQMESGPTGPWKELDPTDPLKELGHVGLQVDRQT